MALFNKPALDANEALQALETEWGESILYCTTGNFLGASGLGEVPLATWGLIALTPTRIMFRHYSQSHPLMGIKDKEINWFAPRRIFTSCTPRVVSFWTKLFSKTPDHLSLDGEGVQLLIEVLDSTRKLAEIWASY